MGNVAEAVLRIAVHAQTTFEHNTRNASGGVSMRRTTYWCKAYQRCCCFGTFAIFGSSDSSSTVALWGAFGRNTSQPLFSSFGPSVLCRADRIASLLCRSNNHGLRWLSLLACSMRILHITLRGM